MILKITASSYAHFNEKEDFSLTKVWINVFTSLTDGANKHLEKLWNGSKLTKSVSSSSVIVRQLWKISKAVYFFY